MTRVVHVITGLGLGGAEMVLYRLMDSLRNRPDQHHTVVSLSGESCFDFNQIGVPLIVVDINQLGLFRGYQELRRALAELKPDVVQGWMLHACLAATLSLPRGVPMIWGIHHALHDLNAEKPFFRVLLMLGVLVSRFSSVKKILFVSHKSLNQHIKIGYKESMTDVIPNGYDPSAFCPNADSRVKIRAVLDQNENRLLIGNFSRVHPVKNHEMLIRAFASLSKEFPDARLVLAGNGTENKDTALARYASSRDIRDKVLFLGPRKDMAELSNALDIYAMSSRVEAFPNVLSEACATGVPCVATDVGDNAVILGGTGRLVPSEDETAFTSALRELLRMSPQDRKDEGARARKHIAANFSQAKMAESYSALYEGIAEEARPNKSVTT
ncbi:MAG: glycosyltransferase [Proteobacteria bacterium]|nr:glycosyltransferase [Pseudomonadota bacterium]